MAKIIYLTGVKEIREQNKHTLKNVIIFPLFRLVFDKIQQIKNDIYNRKIGFLHKQAYIEFYYQFAPRESYGVDIPAFMYEEQRKKRAYNEATKALLQVIKDCRVNECYKARKDELKKRGIYC